MKKEHLWRRFLKLHSKILAWLWLVSDMVSVKQGLNPNILNVNYIFKHMYVQGLS